MLKRGFQFAPGYRLQDFLGRGQFGQVWRATAPGGAAAAIKFIDLTDGQGQKEYDGIKRVKQIRHANLMPITAIWLLDGQGQVIDEAPDEAIQTIDLGVQEGKGQSGMFLPQNVDPSWLAVAMLLGGESLQKRLRQCVGDGLEGIPPKELVRYMDESAKGLDFLNAPQHDLGEGPIAIQHCDVKPANIVLIGDSAVVCDFGLARILTRNQVTATSAAGTPAYMAPEAISGKPSKTSDQYSLAVTYYHLRTGTLPVDDGSLWEVLDAHRRGKLKLGLVPEPEQEVLRKATDLNWEERFESNVDFVDAIREALRDEGHTRPSFVPSSRSVSQAAGGTAPISEAEPATGVVNDPTATLGTEMFPPPASPQEAFQRTAPVIEAEESTDANIPTDTLESVPVATPSEQPVSPIDTLKRVPKAAIAAALGGLLMLGIGGLMWPDGDPPVTGPDTKGTNGGGIVNEKRPALEIFSEAVTKLAVDEPSAMALAVEAIDLDPSLAEIRPVKLSGHQAMQNADVFATILTPDSKRLVTVAHDDTPLLWNLDQAAPDSDLRPIKLVGHLAENRIEDATAESGQQRLVTAGLDSHSFVWNLDQENVESSRLELSGHESSVVAVAWHPTEPIVVTGTLDSAIHVSKLGKGTTEEPKGKVDSESFKTNLIIRSMAIDPTGNWLVVVTDSIDLEQPAVAFRWSDVVSVLDVPSAPEPIDVVTEKSVVECFSFTRDDDGKPLLVTGDDGGSLSLWNFTEQADQKLRERITSAHGGMVMAVRVVQDGDTDVIVSGGLHGSVHLERLGTTREKITRSLGSAPVAAVDVSADGRWVVAGTEVAGKDEGSVWLWDSAAEPDDFRAVQLNFGSSSVTSVLLSGDGKWIVVGRKDGTVQLWDQRRAKLLALTQPISPPSSKPLPVMNVEQPTLTRL